MGVPDHFTCLLKNLYVGEEAKIRTRHGTTDWFKIGKGVWQGCILSPCLFNLNAEYIIRNVGHKLESRFPGKYQQPQTCRWYHPSCKKWRGTKEPLDEGEREELKAAWVFQFIQTEIQGICLGMDTKNVRQQWKEYKVELLLLLSCFSCVWLWVTVWTAVHQALCPWDSPGKNTGVGCHFLFWFNC